MFPLVSSCTHVVHRFKFSDFELTRKPGRTEGILCLSVCLSVCLSLSLSVHFCSSFLRSSFVCVLFGLCLLSRIVGTACMISVH